MPQRFLHSVSEARAAFPGSRVRLCSALVALLVLVGFASLASAQPAISVADSSVVEGDSSAENVVLRFPLTLSETSPNDVSVLYTTAGGTAIPGSDYLHVGGAVAIIPAGESTGFADVAIVEDLNVENDETFSVTLSSPTNATLGQDTATGTILNDEDNITVSIGDADELEGDPGDDVRLQFPLTLSAPPTKEVTVRYTTFSGSASASSDYLHVNNVTATFEAGETSFIAEVQVVEDLNVEADETFSVRLTAPTNTVIADDTGVGTILNDEDNITVSVGNAIDFEGDFASDNVVLQFPLTLSGPPTKPVTVAYHTMSGTAGALGDYVATNAIVTFDAGETEAIVEVAVVEDLNVEPDEWFFVMLSSPTNVLIHDGTATGTILNDEDNITVSIGDAMEFEGDLASDNVVLQFPLTLSGPPTKPATVAYFTMSGTAGAFSDFVGVNAIVTFDAGETEAIVEVAIVEDLNVEPDETFTVRLNSPTNALIDDGIATGTILNDEDNITVSIGDAMEFEGDPGDDVRLRFPLTLSGPPTKPVTVRYLTINGVAVASSDFIGANAIVTFDAGEAEVIVEVAVVEDLNVEPDENLFVALSSPSNTLIDDGTAIGVILNDDGSVDVPPSADPVPTVLAFAGVTPNPLVAGGTIGFSLPVEAGVRLDVYDVRGRRVAQLVDGRFAPGAHSVPWSGARGNRLTSGVYVLRFEALGRVFTSRAVVIR